MADYEPIDISAVSNAPLSVLGQDSGAVAGAQTFRGLPFLVGGSSGDALVSLGSGASVSIPLGSAARRVIFAHRLMETKVPEADLTAAVGLAPHPALLDLPPLDSLGTQHWNSP